MSSILEFLNATHALPISIPVGLFFAWKLGFFSKDNTHDALQPPLADNMTHADLIALALLALAFFVVLH